jgi:hypothetical protein
MSTTTHFKSGLNLLIGVSSIHLSLSSALALYKLYLKLRGECRTKDNENACVQHIQEARDEITGHLPLLTAVVLGSHMNGRVIGTHANSSKLLLAIYLVRALMRSCSCGDASMVRKVIGLAQLTEYGALISWVADILGFV